MPNGEHNTCLHCEHELEHVEARSGKSARWYCEWCGRAGEYGPPRLSALGKVVTDRIEITPGAASKARRWVPADSIAYPERNLRS